VFRNPNQRADPDRQYSPHAWGVNRNAANLNRSTSMPSNPDKRHCSVTGCKAMMTSVLTELGDELGAKFLE
jgi:hypothetical protein